VKVIFLFVVILASACSPAPKSSEISAVASSAPADGYAGLGDSCTGNQDACINGTVCDDKSQTCVRSAAPPSSAQSKVF
jgi:hypothetical protein